MLLVGTVSNLLSASEMICMAPDSFKSNYNLPMHEMLNTDLGRILKSPRAPSKESHRRVLKKNPLKNLRIMLKLNPYAKTMRRNTILRQARNVSNNSGFAGPVDF